MGVFLRFGEERRLVEVALRSSGNFGNQVEPEKIFTAWEPGDDFVEVHPTVLEQLRPQAFQNLAGHCVLVRDGLKVDDIATIRARLVVKERHALEGWALVKAKELGSLKLARQELGAKFPSSAEVDIERSQREMENYVKAVDRVGVDSTVPESAILTAYAGQIIPI